jgi:peptidoglycan/LPS O-acetylase OafA/YrhL
VPTLAESVREPGSARDRELGNLSYPLYLFHWIPAFYLRRHIGFYAGHDFAWSDAPLVVATWSASFAGAALIWRFIDLPIERVRHGLERNRRASAVLQPRLDVANGDG